MHVIVHCFTDSHTAINLTNNITCSVQTSVVWFLPLLAAIRAHFTQHELHLTIMNILLPLTWEIHAPYITSLHIPTHTLTHHLSDGGGTYKKWQVGCGCMRVLHCTVYQNRKTENVQPIICFFICFATAGGFLWLDDLKSRHANTVKPLQSSIKGMSD